VLVVVVLEGWGVTGEEGRGQMAHNPNCVIPKKDPCKLKNGVNTTTTEFQKHVN
jgi:hypothetical protein